MPALTLKLHAVSIEGIPNSARFHSPVWGIPAGARPYDHYAARAKTRRRGSLKRWSEIMKLFGKTDEDPYQMLAGLERDLRRWLTEWVAQRRMDDLPLDEHDTSGRLLIPKRVADAIRELETELAHMNRVSMLGEMAASLFHEITQPIASARNNARAALNFLDRQPPELHEVREALGCVVGDADRAGDIVDRIRGHIKKAPPRKEHFDLNATINEVIVLARSAIIRNDVSVRARLADGMFPVHGDRIQLQQVVLNLILNAVEAMGSVESGPRELLISAEQDHAGVRVAVRDSGPGIDPMHLERVFEAFYTTKSSGVGIGLSICRCIIDDHGGRLWAEANEPRGAAFQFILPRA